MHIFNPSHIQEFPKSLQVFKNPLQFVGILEKFDRFQHNSVVFQVIQANNIEIVKGIEQIKVPYPVCIPVSSIREYSYELEDFIEASGNAIFYSDHSRSFLFLNKLYTFNQVYSAFECSQQQTFRQESNVV